jgi:hypothetical protein
MNPKSLHYEKQLCFEYGKKKKEKPKAIGGKQKTKKIQKLKLNFGYLKSVDWSKGAVLHRKYRVQHVYRNSLFCLVKPVCYLFYLCAHVICSFQRVRCGLALG